jgi:hypothetical protein
MAPLDVGVLEHGILVQDVVRQRRGRSFGGGILGLVGGHLYCCVCGELSSNRHLNDYQPRTRTQGSESKSGGREEEREGRISQSAAVPAYIQNTTTAPPTFTRETN